MEKDWVNWTEIIHNITDVIAVFTILGLFMYRTIQRQLFLATMTRLTDIYRDNYVDLKQTKDEITVKKYIDFVNEELFFMQNKYIPRPVIYEWIDGMIELIPITYNKKIWNEGLCLDIIHRKDLLKNYQRVGSTFTISKNYDLAKIYGIENTKIDYPLRKKLVKEISKNLSNRWIPILTRYSPIA